MDLERVIAKLHEELGLIDEAIANLERLPVHDGGNRSRGGRPAGPRRYSSRKRRNGKEPHGDSKNSH